MKKLMIIDAHALIHRAFHALPPLSTKKGQQINAVYGFLLILLKALKDLKPDYLAVAFDSKGKTFRHSIYTAYKANRPPAPDELRSQFPIVHEVVDAFGFKSYAVPEYEADDLIGTICAKFDNLDNQESVETIIVSGDHDLLQLVDSNTKMMKLHKGVKETVLYDPATVKKLHGITPEQITDYKGLRGDSSDNIPGVKGIGEKGAITLLTKYGTIENVYKNLNEITGREKSALEGSKDDALLSKRLATIANDAPIDFNLEDAKVGNYDRELIVKLFQKYGFKALLLQLNSLRGFEVREGLFEKQDDGSTKKKRDPRLKYHLAQTPKEIRALAAELKKQKLIAFDTETNGLRELEDGLVGISMSWKESEGWYLACGNSVPKEIKAILEDSSIKKTGHNLKFDIKVLRQAGVYVKGVVFDTMIASYLLDASARSHGLDNLVFTEFGYQMQPIEELIGKGKNQITMSEVPVEDVSWYAAEDADFSLRLYNKFQPLIVKEGFEKLMNDFELPTMWALVEMEMVGIRINVEFLNDMSITLHKRIMELEKEIQKTAGVEFNVASNVQLKEVLFDRMNISTEGIKKTKTGFSTAASELEKLRGRHTIIDMISEYRELAKLTTTYIDTLPKLINPHTGRIHTSYSQTVAATGRLSSLDPNLQNIPIRTELGREIRKAFIPDKGKKLLALDYSQIELRVVAHLANDPVMKESFKNGEDIHIRTAAELNDVPLDRVTPDMRRQAKAINFGILYGMGVQGVMRDSGVGREEAQHFLDKYFTIHKGIARYIDKIKKDAREKGYAETMFGRRRPLPEINSSNRMIAAGAERAAINMPVQGTSADLMKLAMVQVQQHIAAGKIDATTLLQVHDELVFEVDAKAVEKEAVKIKKIMEETYTLSVPLTVQVEAGDNWGELHDL